jgi:predicted metal-dependent hydrolase
MRRARRLRLRFDEASGSLKLTCPWRTSRRAALAWALDQRDWIEAQLKSAAAPEPLVPGASFPIAGREVPQGFAREPPPASKQDGDRLICAGRDAAEQRP